MTSNSGTLKHLPPLSASTFQHWKNLVFSYCLQRNVDDHFLSDLVAGEKDAVAKVVLLSQKSEAAGIIGENLGVELYAKFVNDENQKQPHTLWSTICSHFESSSKENQSMVYLDFLKVGFTESGGLPKLITDLDVSIANLRNVGIIIKTFEKATLDEGLLSEYIVNLLPLKMETTREIILNKRPLTISTVLRHFNSKHLSQMTAPANSVASTSESTYIKSESAMKAALTKCANGRHNKLSHHPENMCYHIHPKLAPELYKKRNQKKANATIVKLTQKSKS
ncbi:hypothetical protein MJO29_015667 [Puccinia striiformis f. sp. tritici]|nr:hypothetical protein MJO29_015667 [Puccinia striiformis f. sp. tritici]